MVKDWLLRFELNSFFSSFPSRSTILPLVFKWPGDIGQTGRVLGVLQLRDLSLDHWWRGRSLLCGSSSRKSIWKVSQPGFFITFWIRNSEFTLLVLRSGDLSGFWSWPDSIITKDEEEKGLGSGSDSSSSKSSLYSSSTRSSGSEKSFFLLNVLWVFHYMGNKNI